MILASVSLSRGFTQLRCTNTNEQTEVLLGMATLGDQGNIVLDTNADFPTDSMRPSTTLLWPFVYPRSTCNSGDAAAKTFFAASEHRHDDVTDTIEYCI